MNGQKNALLAHLRKVQGVFRVYGLFRDGIPPPPWGYAWLMKEAHPCVSAVEAPTRSHQIKDDKKGYNNKRS